VGQSLQQAADQDVCSHDDRRIGSATGRSRGGPVRERQGAFFEVLTAMIALLLTVGKLYPQLKSSK
jgi:hypothetical protein